VGLSCRTISISCCCWCR